MPHSEDQLLPLLWISFSQWEQAPHPREQRSGHFPGSSLIRPSGVCKAMSASEAPAKRGYRGAVAGFQVRERAVSKDPHQSDDHWRMQEGSVHDPPGMEPGSRLEPGAWRARTGITDKETETAGKPRGKCAKAGERDLRSLFYAHGTPATSAVPLPGSAQALSRHEPPEKQGSTPHGSPTLPFEVWGKPAVAFGNPGSQKGAPQGGHHLQGDLEGQSLSPRAWHGTDAPVDSGPRHQNDPSSAAARACVCELESHRALCVQWTW
ncbi:uncharacterized protein LOC122730138 isoform X2 [Dromiciops gliroides]|uniref:uncharacterized protein LOC122730138 isoform X2 n=1 Tax=Dromiciops gliroides TaxID=33562 RepID=UPI001CC568B5|nr:uncharacterized protein LOC122730138 isoform X2 [Dromiciops gliroides]